MLGIIFAIITVISYFFVTRKDIKGIYGWLVSNTYFLIVGIINKDLGQIVLWSCYNILNIYALKNWRKENGKNISNETSKD